MDNYAVRVEGLRVLRGRREVLHDVTLAIRAGSITGLIGPSGCGKTTLMRSIVGVQVVHAGTITVLGLPAGSPSLRRRIGYGTQSQAVYSDLTVAENLRYFAAVLGAPPRDTDRVLAEVGLGAQRNQQVGQLSSGQLSRTSLAVALLGEPQLLVLDEPTVGLDPVLREELWDLFHRLRTTRGTTLLVSSHVMDEAVRCQQLILMRDGAILAHDSPGVLCASTGTESLEQAFLHLVKDRTAEAPST
jgi:ABC-2 type transport system ATP-binding protein